MSKMPTFDCCDASCYLTVAVAAVARLRLQQAKASFFNIQPRIFAPDHPELLTYLCFKLCGFRRVLPPEIS